MRPIIGMRLFDYYLSYKSRGVYSFYKKLRGDLTTGKMYLFDFTYKEMLHYFSKVTTGIHSDMKEARVKKASNGFVYLYIKVDDAEDIIERKQLINKLEFLSK